MKHWLIYVCCLLLSGCTLTPTVVLPQRDTGLSGVLGPAKGGGLVVTHEVIDRFDVLCKTYGDRLLIPRKAGWGYTPTSTNTFILQKQAEEDYVVLLEIWRANQEVR